VIKDPAVTPPMTAVPMIYRATAPEPVEIASGSTLSRSTSTKTCGIAGGEKANPTAWGNLASSRLSRAMMACACSSVFFRSFPSFSVTMKKRM
jgi:hypothetical protein